MKLLTVAVDRLRRWYQPGLLCIGDAAHAMSPIGGVGINLAVQDAVAAANILAEPLRRGAVTVDTLKRHSAAPRISDALHATPADHVAKQPDRPGACKAPASDRRRRC